MTYLYLLAGALGTVNSFDNPARQAFVPELVGPAHIANAISLMSVMINFSRILGSAIGGAVAAAVGLGWCFLLDGLSFDVEAHGYGALLAVHGDASSAQRELMEKMRAMTAADFTTFIADETAKWTKVVRFANIKPE